MGINDIHILIHDSEPKFDQNLQIQTALTQLIADHRQGKHPWGEKRRECPLCQQGK